MDALDADVIQNKSFVPDTPEKDISEPEINISANGKNEDSKQNV